MLEGKFAERNSYICLILLVCQDLHLTEAAIHSRQSSQLLDCPLNHHSQQIHHIESKTVQRFKSAVDNHRPALSLARI